MPHYKLTYFPIRGRAECIRMVFAAAGVEFENVRVNPEEWFTKLKQCEYMYQNIIFMTKKSRFDRFLRLIVYCMVVFLTLKFIEVGS